MRVLEVDRGRGGQKETVSKGRGQERGEGSVWGPRDVIFRRWEQRVCNNTIYSPIHTWSAADRGWWW